MGPSASAGKNVSPATIAITPATRNPNSGVCVGIVPAVAGTFGLAARAPPIASAGMIVKNRAINIEMPCVVVYHWVPVPWYAKAEPLLLAVEA